MIVLFNGIRNLMRADAACREAGIISKVMPVPHTYSTECGMSLVIEDKDIELFQKIIESLNLTVEIKNDFTFTQDRNI